MYQMGQMPPGTIAAMRFKSAAVWSLRAGFTYAYIDVAPVSIYAHACVHINVHCDSTPPWACCADEVCPCSGTRPEERLDGGVDALSQGANVLGKAGAVIGMHHMQVGG